LQAGRESALTKADGAPPIPFETIVARLEPGTVTRRELLRYAGFLGAALTFASCTPRASSPHNSTGLAMPQMKPIVQGVVDRGGVPETNPQYHFPPTAHVVGTNGDGNYQPVVRTGCLSVSWAQLQSSAGGPITANNPIDRMVADIRSASGIDSGYRIILRIFAGWGPRTPAWLRAGAGTIYISGVAGFGTDEISGAIGAGDLSITLVGTGGTPPFPAGGGVLNIGTESILIDSRVDSVLTVNAAGRGYNGTMAAPHADRSVTWTGAPVYQWWQNYAMNAYADLHAKLAAKYDSFREIAAVVGSLNTCDYPEVLLRWQKQIANVTFYYQNGYNETTDWNALTSMLNSHDAWKTTRSIFACNPYEVALNPRDSIDAADISSDNAITINFLHLARSILGQRAILSNNSLRTPDIHATMNAAIKALGPPIEYQTANQPFIGGTPPGAAWETVYQFAVAQGANAVEMLGISGLTDYSLDPNLGHSTARYPLTGATDGYGGATQDIGHWNTLLRANAIGD
jgi:hypothetical protein